jgi:hypothetical protein
MDDYANVLGSRNTCQNSIQYNEILSRRVPIFLTSDYFNKVNYPLGVTFSYSGIPNSIYQITSSEMQNTSRGTTTSP